MARFLSRAPSPHAKTRASQAEQGHGQWVSKQQYLDCRSQFTGSDHSISFYCKVASHQTSLISIGHDLCAEEQKSGLDHNFGSCQQ